MWVWVCMRLCLYKTHSLQTRGVSASFSCGCLCVASPVNPAGHSFYTYHSPFPNSTCCKTLRSCTWPKTSPCDTALYVCASTRKHIKMVYAHTEVSHKHARTCTQVQVHTVHAVCRSRGDKGRRITGGPWGAEQVICLKHDQTEHTPT